jgi:hypothetical protein
MPQIYIDTLDLSSVIDRLNLQLKVSGNIDIKEINNPASARVGYDFSVALIPNNRYAA